MRQIIQYIKRVPQRIWRAYVQAQIDHQKALANIFANSEYKDAVEDMLKEIRDSDYASKQQKKVEAEQHAKLSAAYKGIEGIIE